MYHILLYKNTNKQFIHKIKEERERERERERGGEGKRFNAKSKPN